MELMRILHVHSGNLYGGVETVLTTLARRQDVCPDMQQQFALCFEGRLSRELASIGPRPHSIGPVRVSRPLTVLRGRRELGKLLARGAYDALVFHSAWSHAIFAPVGRTARKPSVVWVHGTTSGKHWSERWARRMDPDVVLCNSRFTANGAAAVYPKVSMNVLYYPLELKSVRLSSSDRTTVRAELNTPGNATVIVQVSRMERWKGQLPHIEALSRLKAIPDWICWFVGGPQRPEEQQYFEELREATLRLGIAERVRFLNERNDVQRLLGAADIFCQPNLGPEPFGICFVEALAAGLPVVAAGMGGATEIINETCGMLVRPGNTEEIAQKLQQLIENPDLRRKLGQGGPARARELCDPTVRIKELSSILTGVISLQSIKP